MKVQLTAYASEKMRHYVDNCKGEVSGMGKVEIDGDTFIITDCTIFEQIVSGAHTNIETEALAKFQVEMIKAGEDLGKWTLWWHSHASMKVFWSGTDKATIDNSTEFQYMLSLVTNHDRDILARVDTYSPIRMTQDNLDVYIQENEDEELKEKCLAELKAKVSERVVPISYGYNKTLPTPYKSELFDEGGYPLPTSKKKEEKIEDEESDNNILRYEEMEEYYDYKEELEFAVSDAEDVASMSVASTLLADHIRKGVALGFEN
jgi:hypothetical protein